MTRNQRAFLDMIAYSELGPKLLSESDNGYNVIVGGTLFHDYADHPRQSIKLPRLGIKSTAAGRYQILARYFDAYKKILKLPDFSPASQDKIALQLIRECRALDEIERGDIEEAIKLCRSRWASLPGAGYSQHENKLDDLLAAYELAIKST
jgi:muramidase (phage lysozyme)